MSREIPLTQGKVTIVDDEEFEPLSKYKWFATKCGNSYYAARRLNGKTILMHRYIMNPENRLVVDHVDGDSLNNQKSNLRICSKAQNNRNQRIKTNNKSGYKGVYWREEKGKWQGSMRHNSKTVYLGLFTDQEEAARAYNQKAVELFGEFARLNEIPKEDGALS
ncbi:hypothetical protein AYJ08_05835 [Brevibacillus sp. SKDU10]|uniref:HNH endonuclease n=1 Tax=Brevibacillus sp. SKDU10 TaxID=1247872 RepID=UPI0007D814BB|nr:HNH endonuclease [Brevibacillus sp. SKDU10]OAJ75137.1 hypothetical protein AYJ08_05835 [Brevibacillus sp. SKDU10]